MEIEPLGAERHHWWPESVSEHWNDYEGCTNCLLPSGEVRRAPAKNFGVIKNGHQVRLGEQGEPTVWDTCFEDAFDRADSNFRYVIEWLDELDREYHPPGLSLSGRFLAQSGDVERIELLAECIVSLVVRSPKFRESAVSLAEHSRGPLPARERLSLIGVNMMHCQRRIADSIGTRGKFAVLYAVEREFIFGDGFYHNLSSSTQSSAGIRIVVPVTPYVTVLYANPMQYRTDPKLVTACLYDDEVDFLNDTVQVYANNFIFYKTEAPELIDSFKLNRHRVYGGDSAITDWIDQLSGVRRQQRVWLPSNR